MIGGGGNRHIRVTQARNVGFAIIGEPCRIAGVGQAIDGPSEANKGQAVRGGAGTRRDRDQATEVKWRGLWSS